MTRNQNTDVDRKAKILFQMHISNLLPQTVEQAEKVWNPYWFEVLCIYGQR